MARYFDCLLLAGLGAACGAPPPEGAPRARTLQGERLALTESSAIASDARESIRADTDDAPGEEEALAPFGVSPSPPRASTPVDAGAHDLDGPAADAGSAANACPYPSYPPTEWAPGVWEPVATTDPAELLAGVQATIPGRWEGLATTPWTTPYRVEITFTADGHYSGRCTEVSSDCCVAFYYGSDDETPIKRYRVEDATLSGNVFGEIDIAFAYDAEYGLPAWQGELSSIERDASGNGLRFRFATSHGYGPVEYDLRRAPARE